MRKESKDRIKPIKIKKGHLIDFTKEESFLGGLKQPIRNVEYRIGGITYRVPRGADNPTPDNVVKVGGLFVNFEDGQIGTSLEDVS